MTTFTITSATPTSRTGAALCFEWDLKAFCPEANRYDIIETPVFALGTIGFNCTRVELQKTCGDDNPHTLCIYVSQDGDHWQSAPDANGTSELSSISVGASATANPSGYRYCKGHFTLAEPLSSKKFAGLALTFDRD
jgi:hypothetical protein